MAASPKWKVYRDGKYIGCVKHAEDAAALVSLSGGMVKLGHGLVVWREGAEEFSAGESYDGAAQIMHDRETEANRKGYDAIHGAGAFDRALSEARAV